jgi:hypothetical protein
VLFRIVHSIIHFHPGKNCQRQVERWSAKRLCKRFGRGGLREKSIAAEHSHGLGRGARLIRSLWQRRSPALRSRDRSRIEAHRVTPLTFILMRHSHHCTGRR